PLPALPALLGLEGWASPPPPQAHRLSSSAPHTARAISLSCMSGCSVCDVVGRTFRSGTFDTAKRTRTPSVDVTREESACRKLAARRVVGKWRQRTSVG